MEQQTHLETEHQFILTGIMCSGCVATVEKAILGVENVKFASVNLADNSAYVQGSASPEAIIAAVTAAGYGAEWIESESQRREKQQRIMQHTLRQKRQHFSLALVMAAVLMAYGMHAPLLNSENRLVWAILGILTLATMAFSGGSFFSNALKNWRKPSTMDTLVALSTGTAWLYSSAQLLLNRPTHLYFEAAVAIIGFINLGKYLELKAKQRSSSALEKLLNLAPKMVTVIDGDSTRELPAKAVQKGMALQINAGDRLAVDGVMLRGEIWVDESMLTGEALPLHKKAGDTLRAGTLITDGAGSYQAEQVGEQTTLARVIQAVRHAQSSKPAIAQWVDRIAAKFVPSVCLIALGAALVWFFAFGAPFAFTTSIFTTVLIIACPCALGLAIPLSSVAGVARAAEMGVLVQNMDALQAASEVNTVVFDKTGTLTTGKMQVQALECDEADRDFIASAFLSIESQANHPIAQAISQHFANAERLPVQALRVVKGRGIEAEIAGKKVKIGNHAFCYEADQTLPAHITRAAQEMNEIFMSIDGKFAAQLLLQDSLRDESRRVVRALQQQGYRCVMLTGDREANARYVAEQLGLDDVISDVLPDQKATAIQRLQAQGAKVAMVGDGINDAPALAQANVGIAMHNGSDIALEIADLTLMKSGIQSIAEILPFGQRVMRNMRQSLLGAFIYNVIAIPFAAGALYPFTGWLLNPMIASMAMALSSITVVLNSQRLLKP